MRGNTVSLFKIISLLPIVLIFFYFIFPHRSCNKPIRRLLTSWIILLACVFVYLACYLFEPVHNFSKSYFGSCPSDYQAPFDVINLNGYLIRFPAHLLVDCYSPYVRSRRDSEPHWFTLLIDIKDVNLTEATTHDWPSESLREHYRKEVSVAIEGQRFFTHGFPNESVSILKYVSFDFSYKNDLVNQNDEFESNLKSLILFNNIGFVNYDWAEIMFPFIIIAGIIFLLIFCDRNYVWNIVRSKFA